MTLVDRIDDFGRVGWIAITVLSFVIFWPFGFVVLGFLLGSGRMGCWHHNSNVQGGDRWQRRMDRMQRGVDRMQEGLQRMQARAERWRGRYQGNSGNSGYRSGPSGNHAFDEYRTETLRRLEDEQREFIEFLDRLRHAKDKAEFDQFMAERRAYRDAPPPTP
ncbi:MAG TPA: DUF2852 domain-containing protein [Stellaceae bacterium]|nr:DUF2852 domain-containing protein [Stellaceae bacterium]